MRCVSGSVPLHYPRDTVLGHPPLTNIELGGEFQRTALFIQPGMRCQDERHARKATEVSEPLSSYYKASAYLRNVYRAADLLEATLALTYTSIFPVALHLHNLRLSCAKMAFEKSTAGSKESMH